MPRVSQVKPIDVRRSQINDRVVASSSRDGLPVWEGVTGVECPVINLPLDHMLFRVNNARTRDAQKYATSIGQTFVNIDGSTSVAASDEIFSQEREGEQDTQNHQFELLLEEAQKREDREGNRDLVTILKEDGFANADRPVITPEGVLINGNCRVAAVEHLIAEGIVIGGIDSDNPIIEVKVVPTPPTAEATIEELERKLQLGDIGRLPYNWIQVTTDMRRLLDGGHDIRDVHEKFKHLADYGTVGEMQKWLNARQILDQLLENIGRSGQAYGVQAPQFLMYMAQDKLKKAHKDDWSSLEKSKLGALLELMLIVTLEGKSEGEMRYHLQRIKYPSDVDLYFDNVRSSTGIDCIETIELENPITGTPVESVRPIRTTTTQLDGEQLTDVAITIQSTARDLQERHGSQDVADKPRKKLEEILRQLNFLDEALDSARTEGVELDYENLIQLHDDIIVGLESAKEKLNQEE